MSGGNQFKMRLAGGAAAAALMMGAGAAAAAEPVKFDIAPQSLTAALNEFGVQSNHAVLFTTDLTGTKLTKGVSQEAEPEIALAQMLQGTGLSFRRSGDTFLIVRAAQDPQGGSAAGGGATVEALIVTAQKREEDIQDVPIAISAFSQEDLTRSQIAGGPDLITQVPNMTFTKTNFSSYSIQIRGIGTQAISATTDPAVAVAFNNTPFIRNHFFEQEFYDLQRVEVLRGPQGTLYGRNATAGVVNVISAKPKFLYEAKLSADVANYNSTRLEGMINLPLVEDAAALRLAGAWTKRDGYATNQISGAPIDGRDLWSTRVSLRFSPSDRFDANLIWEHFEEDDDRLRSGKQLCHTDVPSEVAGFTEVDGIPVTQNPGLANTGQGSSGWNGAQGIFSLGCAPASLYSPDSFETPNGFSLPYYLPLSAVFLPAALNDPYVNRTQSHDLRAIESTVDPGYRAKADVAEFQLTLNLTDGLSLTSETAWASDFIFSTQDFNRFNTASGAWRQLNPNGGAYREGVLDDLSPAGYPQFCDPQIGCADRLVAVDLSTARSQHFSQEFRLASDYDGPINFSLGANFLRYDTEDKYYVFINSLSIISTLAPFATAEPLPPYEVNVTDNRGCLPFGPTPPDPNLAQLVLRCTYIDPNPISNLNDLGHNYFLSRNPFKLISYAAFGELYYNISDNLKITTGLRWAVDKKEAPLIPSWVLASFSVGYPIAEVVEQEWREPTGRLAIDWKPDLSFTDETLLYASYAHGYKAGGANPPTYGKAIYHNNVAEILIEDSATHPKTFDAEFVDAYELGAKNVLAEGRVTVNLAAFYYDYEDYQISQIVDRSALNQNFDAGVWGLEIEADWRPLENLRFGFKGGYENTRVRDGEKAIDIMDRTAGHDEWVVTKPFPSIPSNCVLPAWVFVGRTPTNNPELVNLGSAAGGGYDGCELSYLFDADPGTEAAYVADPAQSTIGSFRRGVINYTQWSTDPADYPGVVWPGGIVTDRTYPGWDPTVDYGNNNGEGFFKELGGNELPNAPHFTATITADYTIPLAGDWLVDLHTDLYYQSEAWTRIFNTEGYDKLKAYTNVNLAAIFTNEEAGWNVMAYVKNVFDKDNITGAFLNSDDTGLTTNVFLTEPRLYGLRMSKEFRGGPWWTGANPDHARGEPYPLTIEIAGQVQRHDAPYEAMRPTFIDTFTDGLDTTLAAQNRDLDWGDGRDLKVSYRPSSGPWSLSARFRSGETNGGNVRLVTSAPGDCDPKYTGLYCINKWSELNVDNREEFEIVDFTAERDVGFGGLAQSSVGAGLRYAKFRSRSHVNVDGVPDIYIPKYSVQYGTTHHRYQADLASHREFEGVGPTVSWDAAYPLLGDNDVGRLSVEWEVTGGLLFGKQESELPGLETVSLYQGRLFGALLPTQPDDVAEAPVDIEPRSKSVTVPLAAGSLGLSYEIDRVKLGAGYRWERYFDVLDVGFAEKKDADRTIDGPYLKISVGFGG